MNRVRTTLSALAAAAVAATLLACGLGDGDTDVAGTDTIEPGSTATAGQAPAEQPAAEDKPLPMDNRTAWVYEDGLKVKVGKLKRYRPSDTAAGHAAGNTAVSLVVTFDNGTGNAIDIAQAVVQVNLGADGVQAEQVYDSARNILGVDGTLAPGRRKTVTLAFSAPTKDTSVVDLAVTPTYAHAAALFTGKL